MTAFVPEGSIDRIIDTMIELARCSIDHQIILAGPNGPDLIFGLRGRGYPGAVTTATCKLSRGRYDVAFVAWRQHSINALEATLDWLVHFLSPVGVLVVWIDTTQGARRLRATIERLGFRVEAWSRCGSGFAVSARPIDVGGQTLAA